jgi:hypothetical protein
LKERDFELPAVVQARPVVIRLSRSPVQQRPFAFVPRRQEGAGEVNRVHACALLVLLALTACSARATPYWIAWEGEGETAGMPEEFGWTRNWGNWDGQFQGPGAYRTLEDGILTYDSLYDPGVFDYYHMQRPGQLDPQQPNEYFRLEWRLKVSQVVGDFDPAVGLHSDDAWAVGFVYSEDRIYSVFEGFLSIAITPHVFHDYQLVSPDMRSFQLFVDGALAHEGVLVQKFQQSDVAWGDGVQGAASLHQWDYLRYGVTPEPSMIALAAVFLVCRGGRRR